MSKIAIIIGDSKVRVWGLGGRERLERALRSLGARIVDDPGSLSPQESVIILRGDWTFDLRVLRALLDGDGELLLARDSKGAPVAARVHASRAAKLIEGLDGARDLLPGAPLRLPDELAGGYENTLRKFDVPQVHPIRADNRNELEVELFGGAYKGVTDLVTKWLWPRPAFHATHLCVRFGLKPNHVTLTGLVLAVFAALAFWDGAFGWGLLMAWVMTFLDTVDGKLARVTITSSRFGDVLDHGIDLLHPPFWYATWGLGIAESLLAAPMRDTLIWVIVAGYILGRLCEGAFQLWAGAFSMFIWRPFDSWNRLITARRNPNLILLTISWIAARPDLGLAAVAAWHTASTAVLALRLVIALRERRIAGRLSPWLATIDPVKDHDRLDVRTFTRSPALQENNVNSAT